MSAIGKTSKNDNLVVFKEYLQHRPTGKEPPITIKAKDLDGNFALTTVIENPEETDDKKSYKVKYGEEGTYLTDIKGLPPDAIAKEFDVCENGAPRKWWFVVWEEEPELD